MNRLIMLEQTDYAFFERAIIGGPEILSFAVS